MFIIEFFNKNNNEIIFLTKFMNIFHNYLLSKLTYFFACRYIYCDIGVGDGRTFTAP